MELCAAMRSKHWWDARNARLVKNEEAFRQYNNRRMQLEPVEPDDDDELIPFVCECGDLDCVQGLIATAEQFSEAHSAPNRFIVLPGHVFPEVESVVARHDGFEVVEKLEMDIDALWQESGGGSAPA
jgi:hypothetical protein